MDDRIFNFSAGPAVLPEEVLLKAQQDLFCLPGAGASILEISHRGKAFTAILQAAEANLRELLGIPDAYRVLFLQGGSRLQFSMIPMNLLRGRSADYITTGTWGAKAFTEAKREGSVRQAWDGKSSHYQSVPTEETLELDPEAAYVYFTSNETIQGVQFPQEPQTGGVPLVCDASSDFLCRPLDMPRYGVLYACAQKNAGPAGVTAVIMREEMVGDLDEKLPGMLSYRNHADNNSCYNTPPTFGIYILKLVTDWLIHTVGGLEKMHALNRDKAALLYQQIDSSDGFYTPHAHPDCRSLMNVTFRLPNDELQSQFIEQAADRKLHSLKGHRSVGGIRASIYNAMPREGVERLAEFMSKFRKSHR
ncbi:MAG: 3-phosphoserine/phosphohydroxythreonine transaminase [Pirellulales bacterium]|nr:3-phosphoserine/phosphohydroxythreonine transaminase [Pirellulales bacterium]